MKIKTQFIALFLNLGLALILLAVNHTAFNQSIAHWNPAGLSGFGPSPYAVTTADPNITVTGLTRGSSVTTSGTAAAGGWGGNGWSDASPDDYFTWTMTANAGFQQSLTSIDLRYRRSGTGPSSAMLYYSLNGGANVAIGSMGFPSSSSSGAETSIDLSSVTALQNVPESVVVQFTAFPVGATSTSGTFYVFTGGTVGLHVNGTVSPASATCDAPVNLVASNITDMTADVSWDAQTGAVGYEYIVDMNSTDPAGAGTPTTNLTESVSGLTPVTVYYLHVRTDCGSGNFSPWSTISFTTLVTPCDAPVNLAASNITDMTADVSWDAQTGAVGYEYIVDMNSTDPAGPGTPTTNLTESVSGLAPVTVYYLHVRTDCGSGNFSPWSTISFTTLVTPCDAPINLAASNITDMTADVSWDAQTGAVGYEYVVDMNSTDPAGAGTPTTNLTESVSGLTPVTVYYLHVRTDCGSGNFSPWSTISFTTLVAPCDAPVNLAVSNITDMTADVSWDAQTGAVGYEYIVDMNSTDPAGAGTPTTNLTESVSGLAPVTVYYLHVRTDCGSGNFSPWSTISFTTLVTPCDAPINLAASNITDMTADVSWDAQTGAVGYEYVVDMNSTDPAGAGTPTTNLTESVSGLAPVTVYYLHVRTDCGSGNFSPWSTISFTTLVTPCDAPVNLAVSSVTAVSANVSWDAQTGAVGYEYVVDMNSTDPAGAGTPTTNLTESVSGLTPSTNYYLHTRTNCGGINTSPWTTISFSTDSDLGVNNGSESYFSVYPNPVYNTLTVSFTKTSEKTKITILNLVGQTIYTENAGENTTIDVSFLTAGIYYIRFEQGNVIRTQKIIKK